MECSIIVLRITARSAAWSGKCLWMHTNNIDL